MFNSCLYTPPPPILTSATTPTLSLWTGPWLTLHIQGSGSGQQTPSLLGGCPEEPMQLWAAGGTQETRGTQKRGERPQCVYSILNLGQEGAQAYTEHDEGAVQCINKCHIKRSVWFFHCRLTAEWTQKKCALMPFSGAVQEVNRRLSLVFLFLTLDPNTCRWTYHERHITRMALTCTEAQKPC